MSGFKETTRDTRALPSWGRLTPTPGELFGREPSAPHPVFSLSLTLPPELFPAKPAHLENIVQGNVPKALPSGGQNIGCLLHLMLLVPGHLRILGQGGFLFFTDLLKLLFCIFESSDISGEQRKQERSSLPVNSSAGPGQRQPFFLKGKGSPDFPGGKSLQRPLLA